MSCEYSKHRSCEKVFLDSQFGELRLKTSIKWHLTVVPFEMLNKICLLSRVIGYMVLAAKYQHMHSRPVPFDSST